MHSWIVKKVNKTNLGNVGTERLYANRETVWEQRDCMRTETVSKQRLYANRETVCEQRDCMRTERLYAERLCKQRDCMQTDRLCKQRDCMQTEKLYANRETVCKQRDCMWTERLYANRETMQTERLYVNRETVFEQRDYANRETVYKVPLAWAIRVTACSMLLSWSWVRILGGAWTSVCIRSPHYLLLPIQSDCTVSVLDLDGGFQQHSFQEMGRGFREEWPNGADFCSFGEKNEEYFWNVGRFLEGN